MGGKMTWDRFLDRNHLREGDYDGTPLGGIRGDLRRLERDQPVVLLRDTPEDRERLYQAVRESAEQVGTVEIIEDAENDSAVIDAILAALREGGA